jgi:D-arabinose 1-dehydrogenase-like Zn-dependent alcohol dehydrogenase
MKHQFSFDNFSAPASMLALKGIRIQGSVVSPRGPHKRMLDFAARNGIKPIVETFDMSVEGAEEALDKLGSGDVRYRAVLVGRD